MATLLLTGATGFLGSWILDLMRQERTASRLGYDTVRLFARNAAKARALSLPDAKLEVAEGDLADTDSIRRAAAGVSAVIHVAALYDMRSRWRDFYRTNVEATRALIEGLPPGSRMVLTSTYGIYGFPNGRGITEDFEPKRPLWHYQRTKKLQEDHARAMCRERGIRFVAIRPPTVIGPRELFSVPTMIETISGGRMMLVGNGRNIMPFAHAEDAARAHLLALERIDQNDGEAYHFASFHATFGEYVGAFSDALGVPPVRRRAPVAMARMVGGIGDFFRVLGIQFPYNSFSVAYVASDETLDDSRIRKRLGFVPKHDLGGTVRDCVAWYRKERPRGR